MNEIREILENIRSSRSASGNHKVALVESSIKQPVDIQDHWVESIVLLTSGARTASGTAPDVEVGRFLHAEICLDVTSVSGTTPTLDVYIEGKSQYTGKYRVLSSQTGITAPGTYWFSLSPMAWRYLRVRWVIGGTSPSFTFSVSAECKS